MSAYIMTTFFLLFLPGPVIDPPPDQFIPGWRKFEAAMVFLNKDLYGYIDGGAELFLEYGFVDLRVQRYRHGDSELSLDAYQMAGPDAALAIYLAKKGNEQPVTGVGCRNTGGDYQITALKGRYFIQVNNLSGEAKNLAIMVALLEYFLKQVPEEIAQNWLDGLPADRIPGSELLVAGPYSLQMVYTLAEGDVLQLAGKRFGVCTEVMDEARQKHTYIRIAYPDQKNSQAAFENLKSNLDGYLSKIQVTTDSLTFKDYKNEFGRVIKVGCVIEINLHLPRL
jgi:hypothetical protein